MPRSFRSETLNPMMSVQNFVVCSMSVTVYTTCPSFLTRIGVAAAMARSSRREYTAAGIPGGHCVRTTADKLRRLTSTIVKSGGSSAPEADLVADHLVRANLMGHDSHGVGMIPTYVRHLKAGLVVPNTRAKVVKDDGALLMFDGGRGYGRCVAGEAMSAGIARARQTGVVALTLANAHHIGRIGAYGELAAGAGLVSLHFVNVTDHRAIVAPFRGTDARLVTNPVCISIPGTDRHPALLLDMATRVTRLPW